MNPLRACCSSAWRRRLGWLSLAAAATLLASAACAQSSGLERAPPPASGVGAEASGSLALKKTRLDQRMDSIDGIFVGFNAECRQVDKENSSQVAACLARRKEIVEFARAYWQAFCAYKDDNRLALEAVIATRRADLREKQEQVRRVGLAIDTTARAYQDWADVSEEQRQRLEKEKISSIVTAALQLASGAVELGARALAAPTVKVVHAEKIADALQRKGVADAALLQRVRTLPQGGSVTEQHASIKFVAEWIQNRVELARQVKDAAEAKDQFEQLWATTQALVVLTDGTLKVMEVAGVAAAKMPLVGAAAAGASGAIMIGGHSAIGYFWTYQNMLELASLEEFQLLQVKIATDGVQIAVERLNAMKAQLATYSGDRRCAPRPA
jgi:hypothetical protein